MNTQNTDQLSLFDSAADRLMKAIDRLEENTQPIAATRLTSDTISPQDTAEGADRDRLIEALNAAHDREKELSKAISETSETLETAIKEVREALSDMAGA